MNLEYEGSKFQLKAIKFSVKYRMKTTPFSSIFDFKLVLSTNEIVTSCHLHSAYLLQKMYCHLRCQYSVLADLRSFSLDHLAFFFKIPLIADLCITFFSYAKKMNNTSFSKAEGVVFCSAFFLTSVLIVAGNLLSLVLCARTKALRKKSFFLIINMTFADLMLGGLTLPIYTYIAGATLYPLWTFNYVFDYKAATFFHLIADTLFVFASLLSATFISCERFYATYQPLKHRTLSTNTYSITIFMLWILAVLVATLLIVLKELQSVEYAIYVAVPFTLTLMIIICVCNVGIWRQFQHASAASQQKNRNSQRKRFTKTLVFISTLTLICWLPFLVMNILVVLYDDAILMRFYLMVNILNYSNSFVNPVIYVLRIPEFKQALSSIKLRQERNAAMKLERTRKGRQVTEPRILQTAASHFQGLLEQEDKETKL